MQKIKDIIYYWRPPLSQFINFYELLEQDLLTSFAAFSTTVLPAIVAVTTAVAVDVTPTAKAEPTKTGDSFIIDINFKGTTAVIIIDKINTYEKDENDRDLINGLSHSEQAQEEIIICFQNVYYKIYKILLVSQKNRFICKATCI